MPTWVLGFNIKIAQVLSTLFMHAPCAANAEACWSMQQRAFVAEGKPGPTAAASYLDKPCSDSSMHSNSASSISFAAGTAPRWGMWRAC